MLISDFLHYLISQQTVNKHVQKICFEQAKKSNEQAVDKTYYIHIEKIYIFNT